MKIKQQHRGCDSMNVENSHIIKMLRGPGESGYHPFDERIERFKSLGWLVDVIHEQIYSHGTYPFWENTYEVTIHIWKK